MDEESWKVHNKLSGNVWNSTLLEWPFQKIQNYTIILKKSIYIIQWVIKHMLQLQKEDQQKGWKTWIGKYRFWFRGVQRANLALTHYKLCRNKYWIIFNTCSCIIFFKKFFLYNSCSCKFLNCCLNSCYCKMGAWNSPKPESIRAFPKLWSYYTHP